MRCGGPALAKPRHATPRLPGCSQTSPSRASWPEPFRVLISGSLATPRAGWARAYEDSGHDGLDGGPCAPVALLAISSNVARRGSRELFGSRSIRNHWDPTRVCHSLVSEFSLRGISVRGAVTRQMMLLPTLTSERLIPPEHTIRRVKAVPPG